ncbi:hypothetical protein [Yersinia alsatica]|uniref:hypothetical protein n=1 Tax=Yersinia alsatica TaxID=2890317 RepID=UPI0016438D1E|nr:hypothetical protein [Yersinia alsatica]
MASIGRVAGQHSSRQISLLPEVGLHRFITELQLKQARVNTVIKLPKGIVVLADNQLVSFFLGFSAVITDVSHQQSTVI